MGVPDRWFAGKNMPDERLHFGTPPALETEGGRCWRRPAKVKPSATGFDSVLQHGPIQKRVWAGRPPSAKGRRPWIKQGVVVPEDDGSRHGLGADGDNQNSCLEGTVAKESPEKLRIVDWRTKVPHILRKNCKEGIKKFYPADLNHASTFTRFTYLVTNLGREH
jgi:hypothetical protein